jgi:hypothetical protein
MGADALSPVPGELESASVGLEPFAGLDFVQFAAFLRQAQQYRDSGAVSVPLSDPMAEKVQAGLRALASLADKCSGADDLDPQQVKAEREESRQDLELALAAFLKPLAISVTLKGDQKGFETTLKNARTRRHAAQIRAVLNGVTDEQSLNAPDRQAKLRVIVDGLQAGDLKVVATELGASPSKGSKEALLSAVVERVTGIKPAGKKATRASRKSAVDQAAVQQHAVKLKGLLEKSLDPGGLSTAEVDDAIKELTPMSVAELQATATEVGLEKVGSKKDVILERIRKKLREAEHARESIQV